MRLLNAKTLQIETHQQRIPPYAILSHTWLADDQEVTFQDFQDHNVRSQKTGFRKIRLTCEQAIRHGLEYAWIDTCCIDKTSSSELSESINSMFSWYQRASICYVYLEDVSDEGVAAVQSRLSGKSSHVFWHPGIGHSRWFTRGWTLQELIAPMVVDFYSCGWKKIGEKLQLLSELEAVTGICKEVLGGASPSSVSVAERMSWASSRQTTREEDMSYCLLGLFGISMTMLYGEGTKAFLRLQEAIISEYDDHSIFAWQANPSSEDECPVRGIFALSPREFAMGRGIVSFNDISEDHEAIAITNYGVRINTRVTTMPRSGSREQKLLLNLNCYRSTKLDSFEKILGIEIVKGDNDSYVRQHPSELTTISPSGRRQTLYIAKNVQSVGPRNLQGAESESQYGFRIHQMADDIQIDSIYPSKTIFYRQEHLFPIQEDVLGRFKVGIVLKSSKHRGLLLLVLGTVRPDVPRPFSWLDTLRSKLDNFIEPDEDSAFSQRRYLPWIKVVKLKGPGSVATEYNAAERPISSVQFFQDIVSSDLQNFQVGGDLVSITINPVYVHGRQTFVVNIHWAKDLM